jgi:hypothetical protein
MIKLKLLLKESMFPKEFDRHAVGSCMSAAELATKYLLQKGIKNFKIVEGWVSLYPDQEEEYWEAHTWIKFNNGRIFDPTKKQWLNFTGDDKNPEISIEKIRTEYEPEDYLDVCDWDPSPWENFKKKSLKEIDDTDEWRYWWMDPDLKFHPVEHEGHAGFAIHYLISKSINPKGKDHYYLMYDMGWVRVGSSWFQGKKTLTYNYRPEKPLNDKQHRALNNWAKEQDCVEMRDNVKGKWEFIDEAFKYPMAKGKDVQSYADAVDWKGKIIWMSPDKFLRLAAPLPDWDVNKDAINYLEKRFKEQLPTDFLVLEVDMNRKKVTAHEGRHRAMVAKKLGMEQVPVLIYTGSGFERVPKWDKATHDVIDKVDFAPEK